MCPPDCRSDRRHPLALNLHFRLRFSSALHTRRHQCCLHCPVVEGLVSLHRLCSHWGKSLLTCDPYIISCQRCGFTKNVNGVRIVDRVPWRGPEHDGPGPKNGTRPETRSQSVVVFGRPPSDPNRNTTKLNGRRLERAALRKVSRSPLTSGLRVARF